MDLKSSLAQLSRLIVEGKTVEAMKKFYDEEVEMQENEEAPRQGKQNCIEHEKRSLAGASVMTAQLLHQAIDAENAVVFSEWEFRFTTRSGQKMRLTEVSVQHWRRGLVLREKFYYTGLMTL